MNESAKRNSFQLYTKVRIAVAARPGRASGQMISRIVRSRLAPSTIAASSSSAGSWRKNPTSSQTVSGMAKVRYGSTSPG